MSQYPIEKQRQRIQIPGEDVFLHTFQFDMETPALPIPYQKTLHYPLDSERYNKLNLTSFDIKYSGQLLPRCDLGNSVDQLIINSQEEPKEVQLSQNEQQILDEIYGVQNQKNNLQIQKNRKDSNEDQDVESENQQIQDEEKIDFNHLPQLIEQQFQYIQKIDQDFVHPKKNLKVKKVYEIIPHQQQFASLLSKDIISQKQNLLKIDFDLDKKEILKHFVKKNQEDQNQVFQHQNNYKFSQNISLQDEILFQFDQINNKVMANKIKGNFVIHGQRKIFDKSNIKKEKDLELSIVDQIVKKVKLSQDSIEQSPYNSNDENKY